jgi:hypothetical protein
MATWALKSKTIAILGAGPLGILTAAFLLVFAASLLPSGIAIDRFGPRTVQSVMMGVDGPQRPLCGDGQKALFWRLGWHCLTATIVGFAGTGSAACNGSSIDIAWISGIPCLGVTLGVTKGMFHGHWIVPSGGTTGCLGGAGGGVRWAQRTRLQPAFEQQNCETSSFNGLAPAN